MARRPCLDCRRPTTATRCRPCRLAAERERDRARGSRQERGLDATYDRNRKALLAAAQVCAICGRPGTADDPLTAGHIVARADGGGNTPDNLRAEHASYNYSHGRSPCRAGGDGGGPGGPGGMGPTRENKIS